MTFVGIQDRIRIGAIQPMPDDYFLPIEVTSPRRQWTLVNVVYDRGEGQCAVAAGLWEGRPVLAMRWNGKEGNPVGNPQSRGLPTWFIVPDEFRESILNRLKELEPHRHLVAKEHIMNATILTNTIPLPDVRESVQEAIFRVISEYRTRDPWTAKIFAPADRAGYVIRINGPRGFIWERYVEGPNEQDASSIERMLREAKLERMAAKQAAEKLPGFAEASLHDQETMILTQLHRM